MGILSLSWWFNDFISDSFWIF